MPKSQQVTKCGSFRVPCWTVWKVMSKLPDSPRYWPQVPKKNPEGWMCQCSTQPWNDFSFFFPEKAGAVLWEHRQGNKTQARLFCCWLLWARIPFIPPGESESSCSEWASLAQQRDPFQSWCLTQQSHLLTLGCQRETKNIFFNCTLVTYTLFVCFF